MTEVVESLLSKHKALSSIISIATRKKKKRKRKKKYIFTFEKEKNITDSFVLSDQYLRLCMYVCVCLCLSTYERNNKSRK
jgi:hypothetical protein